MGRTTLQITCVVCFRLCRAYRRWWRHPRARGSAVVAGLCFVYLFFVAVLQVSTAADSKVGIGTGRVPFREHFGQETHETPEPPLPTHSNVVYITLRSKRHKPAVIRATVRPKLRKKKVLRKTQGVRNDGTSRSGQGTWASKHSNRTDTWTQILNRGLALFTVSQSKDGMEYPGNSIRMYSQKPPPWFSPQDISHMHLLTSSRVRKLERMQSGGSSTLLMFSSDAQRGSGLSGQCSGGCGIIKPPVDMSEVFAFHLDRVLGLNRSLPAVSRRFRELDSLLCPVTLWDPSIIPVSGQVTWSSYQTFLKHRCWHQGTPKPEWSCTSIHHYEWSKVALFDFLLQIHQRLDRNCCGFRPRPEDSCVQHGYHAECGDMNSVKLSTIVHRKHDPHHIVFINNKGFFDRDEENLDFKLLEGIKELPDVAVGVLSSKRLREKLLQSLFLDQLYWDSQGGRQGIEKLIDVIEGRAKVLLRYINAHGIKVIPMNT